MARGRRIERFKVKRHRYKSGTLSWAVSGTDKSGKRIREYYPDKADVIARKTELENQYDGVEGNTTLIATSMTREQVAEAEGVFRIANGFPLTKIVSEYVEFEKVANSKNLTVRDAFDFFKTHHREDTKVMSLAQGCELFLESRRKRKASQKTIATYNTTLQMLLKKHPSGLINDVTLSDVEDILDRYTKLSSKSTYLRGMKTFFNWASRHNYCLHNPCDRIEKLPPELSKIAILSLEEVKRLLACAMSYQGGVMVAPVAIALFAGLRPSEIRDLQPEQVTNEQINVTGGKRRRTLNRITPIPPNLKKWLNEFSFQGLPVGHERKMRTLRNATNAKHWVQDVIRHTSISNQLQRDKNEAQVSFHCGTSLDMINRHYRNVIADQKEVAAYWKLTPTSIRKENIQVEIYKSDQIDIDWPSPVKLKKLVKEKPVTHIAKELGVSDNAVRKHCKKLEIELPGRGHWAKVKHRKG